MLKRWRLGTFSITVSRGDGSRRFYAGFRYGPMVLLGHWALLIRRGSEGWEGR